MESSVYAVEAEVESTHWWFVGRRRLIGRILRELRLPDDATILDIGSGTGTNLRLLSELGYHDVTGVDSSDDAIHFCDKKGLGTVLKADASELPGLDSSCDLILATDILEHLDDEALALSEIQRVLRPGGFGIITVPAFPSLWGLQDEVSHHKRRYRRGQLEERLEHAGLRVRRSFYFNYILFGPIWLARQLIRVLRVPLASENQLNHPWLNQVLSWIFEFDVRTAAALKPAFGVSLFVLIERERS